MTGANGGSLPAVPRPTSEGAGAIDAYIEANQDRFTPDALEAALVAAGHDREAANAAIRRVASRRAAGAAKGRARRVVVIAYGLVYLVLVAGLLGGPYNYGEGTIGAVILTIMLGIALAIGLWWIGRRRTSASMGGLLVLPLVLLIAIGGICSFSSGSPFILLRQDMGDETGPTAPTCLGNECSATPAPEAPAAP
jgi:hypothetical protein